MITIFYEFRQNNSGGSFDIDEKAGISVQVIVEGDTLSEAVDRALSIGIYFDGIEKGYDCDCCGDRWSEPWDTKGDPVPSHYGTPIEETRDMRRKKRGIDINWAGDRPYTFIHYKDGTVEALQFS